MKKTVLAIFAHPDDEAFGPAGTIALLSQEYDLKLVCVTNGGEGERPDNFADLVQLRRRELESSAQVLGVSDVLHLGFKDGSLSNGIYHTVGKKIREIADETKPEMVLTFEPRGLTGHLDHIAVTSIVNHIYNETEFIKKILYYSLLREQTELIRSYFVHFPDGYEKAEISSSVDISSVYSRKMAAIQAHSSQKNDIAFWMPLLKDRYQEHFIIKSRKRPPGYLLRDLLPS